MAGIARQKPTIREPSNAPEDLAANLLGRNEKSHRKQFELIELPHDPLQIHGLGEIRVAAQRPDTNHPLWRFASCQSDSISSMVASRSVLPDASKPSSTCAKRRRNFALVPRKRLLRIDLQKSRQIHDHKQQIANLILQSFRLRVSRASSNSANSSRS